MPSSIIDKTIPFIALNSTNVRFHTAKKMNDNLILPVIFILVVFASIVTITYFFETQNSKLYQLTIDRRNTDLDNLATVLGDRLNSTFDIITSTSGLPSITAPPRIDLINKTLHGIAQYDDMPKREVAKDILQNVKDVETVRFLLPNGDMYLLEPYSNQTNLQQNNFASFDYYKGSYNYTKTIP